MKVWVVHFSHRHGHDIWVEWSKPNEQDVIESLRREDLWDERDEAEGSYVEVLGPYQKPPS